MALVLADRVKETTTSTGTGTITLAGASTGYQSFSVIGNGNTTYYAIVGTTEWEVGIGTYTASGTTLSRDTVLSSSNSGSLVNFSAGAKDVFVTYPAEKAVNEDASGNVSVPGGLSATGSLAVAGTSATAADFKLYEDTDNGTNYVGFKAPTSVGTNIQWVLPSADGTNGYVLSTDGSGNLSWVAQGGGGGGVSTAKAVAISLVFGY